MTFVLIYLLKVSLAISLVTIPYYLWLRQDAALNVKRFYLTGGITLSWLFPMIVIKKPEAIASFNQVYFLDPYAVSSTSSGSPALAETGNGFSLSIFSLVIGLYLTGLLILTLRHFFMLRKLKRIERKEDRSDHTLIYTNSNEVFTLFSKIFIPNDLRSSKDLDSILIHEKAHLQQLHMIDLIIAETNLLLTWFNPFSWLISRMIKENHEHLADRTVLSKGVNPAHYKAQLLNHSVGVELFRLGNQFNHSLTKKRFQMMKKIKSPKKGFIKYLALVPAILIALGLFTAASAQQKPIQGKVVLKDGTLATGAAVVVYGGTQGCVVDKEGEFSLDLEEPTKIVISFVGYKTEIVQSDDLADKVVILQPEVYEIDLKDVKAKNPAAVKPKKESDKEAQDKKKVLSPDDPEVFYIVEEMPSFPGGRELLKGYIVKNLAYPEKAKKKGLSGEVYVQFTVDTKGELKDFVINRSTDKIFDKAAIGVFEDMPAWSPGKQRGKAVSTKVTVPVRFNAMQN